MSSSGPNGPGNEGNNNSVGTVAWVNPSNAALADGNYATASLNASAVSQYLTVSNFGFSVPAGATMNGVLVEVLCQNDPGGNIQDNSIRLYSAGNPIASDKAVASNWPGYGFEAYRSYGGSADLWGFAVTPALVNAVSFGAVISAKNVGAFPQIAYVDYVRITVYFTVANQVVPQCQVIDVPVAARLMNLWPD